MAGKAVEIHPEALNDLTAALTWYRDRSHTAALNFSAEVERGILLISESPQSWPSGAHATRKFILRRFPFALVYREIGSGVQIVAVAHGHRRPSYWKSRL